MVGMYIMNYLEVVDFTEFPNKETAPKAERITTLLRVHRPKNLMLAMKYESNQDLLHLKFLVDTIRIRSKNKTRLSLRMPYIPYSRQDRDIEASGFALKSSVNLINSLNFDFVEILEPHSDVSTALINNAVKMYGGSTANLLNNLFVQGNLELGSTDIFFPDAGAQKRYETSVPAAALDYGAQLLVGFKKRNPVTNEVDSVDVLTPHDFKPKKSIVIMDDLCSYGGTFLRGGAKLKQLGYEDIYLVVAHCEDSIAKGALLKPGSPIKAVYTTDSILNAQTAEDNADKIKVTRVF